MKRTIVISALLLLPMLASALTVSDVTSSDFWPGFWQGLTLPFRLFLKFFVHDMTIYEPSRAIFWYHVGYLVGVFAIFTGGHHTAK